MSAMHWEARRRQQVLDRRLSARDKQENHQGNKKEQSETHSVPIGSSESLETEKTCICKCQSASEEPCSAKINKRYTLYMPMYNSAVVILKAYKEDTKQHLDEMCGSFDPVPAVLPTVVKKRARPLGSTAPETKISMLITNQT